MMLVDAAPSTATSRSRSSVTSRSSARRSAPAACAWSRSRASRSSRPAARRRSRTAWSSTRRPTACKEAQEAVVEFLLINHPLDCPVCDKGGECPLQDISFGWGGGSSRFIEPKRHFEKPLALSPLIAIDRERCILCYRCVRFSQEVAEDYQLVLHERGAHTYVGTFDGHPYVAPFSGNIIELCPVGALTSRPYRFRARPWDIEQSGSVCTLCPAQCNVSFTVRDERVLRVLARDNHDVDDGWLCDKGRFAYQAIHVDERITQPLVRDGGELRPVPGSARSRRPRRRSRARTGRVGALVGGETTNEEGLLAAAARCARCSARATSTRAPAACSLGLRARSARPALQATVPDLEYAHAVLVLDAEPVDDAPILDLRIRKGVRRNGVKLFVATSRPSRSTPTPSSRMRFAPGAGEALLAALDAALRRATATSTRLAGRAGADADDACAARRALRDARRGGRDPLGRAPDPGPRGAHAARALLNVAGASRPAPAATARACSRCRPPPTAAGCARSACCRTPARASPSRRRAATPPEIAAGAADGELTALYLLHTDPLRDQPGPRAPGTRALEQATTVIAHASFLTEGIAEHATVVFPAESYAEKEGTVTHPDGRLQRLRRAIGRPGDIRARVAGAGRR